MRQFDDYKDIIRKTICESFVGKKKYEVQISRKKLKRIALTGCREQWNFTTMCLLQGCFCDMKWQGTFHVNYLLFYLCFYGLLRCKNSMLDLHIVFETVRTPELNKDDTKGCFKVDGESRRPQSYTKHTDN